MVDRGVCSSGEWYVERRVLQWGRAWVWLLHARCDGQACQNPCPLPIIHLHDPHPTLCSGNPSKAPSQPFSALLPPPHAHSLTPNTPPRPHPV